MKENPISLLQVKEILEARKSEEDDLTYIQKVTLDYASRFTPEIDRAKEEEMITTLEKNFNLRKDEAIQLITLNPQSVNELLLVLGKKNYSEAQLERILELCIQYLG